jgi:CheY-like chemotaxis protein
MTKKLLLIESDAAFAGPLSAALAERGFEVRVAPGGQEGLDLARAERPHAIVLSAELPGGSGFAVCNRIKKERDLAGIPLVLTSARAGEETFEQHRKLKTRAEDYLAKPFAADALVARLAPLVGLPAPAGGAEADVVTLDDVEEIDSTLAALEAAAAREREPAPERPEGGDTDLRALDAAFDAIAAAPTPPPIPPPEAVPTEPANDPAPPGAPEVVDPLAVPASGAAIAVAAEPAPGADAVPAEPPPPDAGAELARRDAEIARLQDRISELLVEAGRAVDERARLEAAVAAARQDAEDARRRLGELEAQAARHEQRVVKAYQRLKQDEQLRDRARKALAIALQLLDDRAAEPPAAAADPAPKGRA